MYKSQLPFYIPAMLNWNLTLKKETPFIIIPTLKCLRLSLTKYVEDLAHKQPQNTDETKSKKI